MKRAGAPDIRAGAALLGVVQRHAMVLTPARGMFLFNQTLGLPLNRLAIERAVFREVLQHPPPRLQVDRCEALRDRMFLTALNHGRHPLHKPRPRHPDEIGGRSSSATIAKSPKVLYHCS